VVSKLGFPFCWRMSQLVSDHYEVGAFTNVECTRARVLVHTQHIVMRYFIHIRAELQNIVNQGNQASELMTLLALLHKRGEITLTEFTAATSAILSIKDNKIISEVQLEPLEHALDKMLAEQTNAAKREGEHNTAAEHTIGMSTSAPSFFTGGQDANDAIDQSTLSTDPSSVPRQLRRTLDQWYGVSMFALYRANVVRSRFLFQYPELHHTVQHSSETRSLVLDHVSSQQHVWFTRKRRSKPLDIVDPYPTLNAFYTLIEKVERRFTRVCSKSVRASVTVFLASFAYRITNAYVPVSKPRSSGRAHRRKNKLHPKREDTTTLTHTDQSMDHKQDDEPVERMEVDTGKSKRRRRGQSGNSPMKEEQARERKRGRALSSSMITG
jgi:hypothetical protein